MLIAIYSKLDSATEKTPPIIQIAEPVPLFKQATLDFSNYKSARTEVDEDNE